MAGCLIISLLLAGCGNKDSEQTGEKEQITPVQTAMVEKGVLSDITTVTGKLEALDSSNVVPGGAGGKVQSVNVALGDKVTRGQVLVVLEQGVQEAALRQAQQGLAQARQGVAQAQSGLEIASINYEQAAANYQRGKELYAAGAIPQAGPTGFETAYEMPYKQAKIDYEQVKPAALATAQAAVATAQAAVDMAQEQYNNTIIRAPISGVITAVNINPGELASPGTPAPLVSVVNLDQVVVKTSVAESTINKIKKGQEVPVQISAVADEPFTGVITNIAAAADPTSNAYPVKIRINNPEHLLKPGMFAEVPLQGEQQETLLVPREAVVKVGDQDTVWVVRDNTVTSRQVKVGKSDGVKIQILEGLEEGEEVVVSGQINLKDKDPVEIINTPTEASNGAKDSEAGNDNETGQDGDVNDLGAGGGRVSLAIGKQVV